MSIYLFIHLRSAQLWSAGRFCSFPNTCCQQGSCRAPSTGQTAMPTLITWCLSISSLLLNLNLLAVLNVDTDRLVNNGQYYQPVDKLVGL